MRILEDSTFAPLLWNLRSSSGSLSSTVRKEQIHPTNEQKLWNISHNRASLRTWNYIPTMLIKTNNRAPPSPDDNVRVSAFVNFPLSLPQLFISTHLCWPQRVMWVSQLSFPSTISALSLLVETFKTLSPPFCKWMCFAAAHHSRKRESVECNLMSGWNETFTSFVLTLLLLQSDTLIRVLWESWQLLSAAFSYIYQLSKLKNVTNIFFWYSILLAQATYVLLHQPDDIGPSSISLSCYWTFFFITFHQTEYCVENLFPVADLSFLPLSILRCVWLPSCHT